MFTIDSQSLGMRCDIGLAQAHSQVHKPKKHHQMLTKRSKYERGVLWFSKVRKKKNTTEVVRRAAHSSKCQWGLRVIWQYVA